MGLIISPDSPYGRELWKWDHPKGMFIGEGAQRVEGQRARGYEPYPAMLYKVTKRLNADQWQYEEETVHDQHEQRNLESRGFVAGGLAAACAAYEASQQELAVLAAARNYEDRNLSAKAKAERDAAEQASSSHLGAIPETPIKRRGRKPKAADAA